MDYLIWLIVIKTYEDLHKLNEQLLKEIKECEEDAAKTQALNRELIAAARRAGRADIASSIIHNIGNVLTSINTSLTMVSTKVASSKISNLEKLSELLQVHQNDLHTFLTTDPKGKRLPTYVSTLSKTWVEDKNYLIKEIKSLDAHIEHIKEVISKQNLLNTGLSIIQEVNAPDLIEEALKLNDIAYKQANITIIRRFSPVKIIRIDPEKFLQVVTNLIKNSIECLSQCQIKKKNIILSLKEQDKLHFIIEINDNGAGISPENLERVFYQGFTSKNCHGYGLHSSLIAVQEMGGELSIQSDRVHQGATFTLLLPYNPLP